MTSVSNSTFSLWALSFVLELRHLRLVSQPLLSGVLPSLIFVVLRETSSVKEGEVTQSTLESDNFHDWGFC